MATNNKDLQPVVIREGKQEEKACTVASIDKVKVEAEPGWTINCDIMQHGGKFDISIKKLAGMRYVIYFM